MNFLNTIADFGVAQAKPLKRTASHDQLGRMRDAFVERARKQVACLSNDTIPNASCWFTTRENEHGERDFFVTLRNGAKQMPLSGDLTYVNVGSSQRAISFYDAAIKACEAGDLDALLLKTRRARGPSAVSSIKSAIGSM